MNFFRINTYLIGLSTLFYSMAATAEVILVAPGDGTLETAVAGANPGDVLELETGMYGGAGFTVDKSLTVRAKTSSDTPTVALTSRLTLGTTSTTQTWQRIRFDGMNLTVTGFLTLQGAAFNNAGVSGNSGIASVRIIESTFTGTTGGINCFSSNCGQEYMLVGNSVLINSTGTIALDVRTAERLYVIGNTFIQSTPQSIVFTSTAASASNAGLHVLGNDFTMSQSNGRLLLLRGDPRFIGNRVNAAYDTAFGNAVATPVLIDVDTCANTQIRNNLIKITDTSAISTTSSGSRVTGINAVKVQCGTANEVSNNVIDFGGFDLGIETGSTNGAIHLESPANVQTNIFTGITKPHFTFGASTVGSNIFRNNLCHNTAESCTNLDGNQDADPLFVDTVDYMLGNGSLAIDAGPAGSAFVIDVDGSRADLGLYGGQFPIDQFDIQREPARTAPFIYPLFNATQDVDSSGNVQIEVISAARLR